MSQAPPPPYPGQDPAYPPGGSAPPPHNPNDPGYPSEKGGPPPPGYQSQGPPGGYPNQGPPPGGYPAGPPPQQPYAQPAQPAYPQTQGPTTVVVQPTTMLVQSYREVPVACNCPHCHATIQTATHYETGTLTWVACAVLCVVGCDLGCCFIPFCVDAAKDVIHTCPNCKQQIARWSRL